MRAGDGQIAAASTGKQAILYRGSAAKLLDQEQTHDKEQQRDRDADKARSLACGDFVAHGLLDQRTMHEQATLLLQRGIGSA